MSSLNPSPNVEVHTSATGSEASTQVEGCSPAGKSNSERVADCGATFCSPSSFLEGAEGCNQSRGLVAADQNGGGGLGSKIDLHTRSSGAGDGESRNIGDADPCLHGTGDDVTIPVVDVNERWEWHEVGELMDMMKERGCRELMLHWTDLFGTDQARWMAFLEYVQRGASFMGEITIRILPRGPWIDIFLENVQEHAPSPAGASVETGGEG
jgi:hypothetical protein